MIAGDPVPPAAGRPLAGRVALVTGVSRRRVEHLEADFLGRPGGRVVLFTSGQQLGPMPGQLAYATSKAALAGITLSLAETLAHRGVTVNTVNPGPTDTGYADPAARERLARLFPAGRWGTPEGAALLVAWLCTDEAAWITGQVINSEGGFRRYG